MAIKAIKGEETFTLKGTKTVLANLGKQLKSIKGKTSKGLNVAAALVKARSISKTPVDTGNLKSSHYINFATPEHLGIEVGCTAYYAIYVHENLEAAHPTGQAKFLQAAIEESQYDIVEVVKKYQNC